MPRKKCAEMGLISTTEKSLRCQEIKGDRQVLLFYMFFVYSYTELQTKHHIKRGNNFYEDMYNKYIYQYIQGQPVLRLLIQFCVKYFTIFFNTSSYLSRVDSTTKRGTVQYVFHRFLWTAVSKDMDAKVEMKTWEF